MATTKSDDDPEVYRLLERIDRLEDLLEEMNELGIADESQLRQRLADLNALLDDLVDERG